MIPLCVSPVSHSETEGKIHFLPENLIQNPKFPCLCHGRTEANEMNFVHVYIQTTGFITRVDGALIISMTMSMIFLKRRKNP